MSQPNEPCGVCAQERGHADWCWLCRSCNRRFDIRLRDTPEHQPCDPSVFLGNSHEMWKQGVGAPVK